MSREHSDDYLVRSYEVEQGGELRAVVLLRMLQETAWNHANRLGKGFSERAEGQLFWVLSRLRVQLASYPRWGETLTIRTFPVGTERLLAIREFVIERGGDVLGRAWSGWLVVDGGGGRPVRPQSLIADIKTTPSQFEGATGKLAAPGDDALTIGQGVALHHDIDQYRHVNNASYLEWAMDAYARDESFPDPALPGEIALDFLRETTHLKPFSVIGDRADESHRFEIRHKDGTAAVRGLLSWLPFDRGLGRR